MWHTKCIECTETFQFGELICARCQHQRTGHDLALSRVSVRGSVVGVGSVHSGIKSYEIQPQKIPQNSKTAFNLLKGVNQGCGLLLARRGSQWPWLTPWRRLDTLFES